MSSTSERVDWLKNKLAHCSDMVYHLFGPKDLPCALIYMNGMVDRQWIQENVLRILLRDIGEQEPSAWSARIFQEKRLPVDQQKIAKSMQDAETCILNGRVLLMVDGEPHMLDLGLTSLPKRAIETPDNESVIRGPREAFTENQEEKLSMLRNRLKTASLKTEEMIIGTETHTSVVIAYIEGICKQELLDEVKRRLSQVVVDGIMASTYLMEFIEDNPLSPFPQMQSTERPDVVAASLLEGRLAIFVEGTPVVVLAPVTLFILMQTADDYYQRFWAATWIRWIRYVFLFFSLILPSFYIAVTTFHPEIIPEQLLITIAASREVVPFPAFIEALLMELFFEALREAAVRIPKSIGQAVSIIGALIIGTAAVEAGIVSPVMVIIVSLTGISSFITPQYDLGLTFRLLRFPIMFLSAAFGLVGIACGLILIYIHLIELRSFGVSYLSPVVPMIKKDMKDTLVRAPWWSMVTRPIFAPSNGTEKRLRGRQWADSSDQED